MLIVNEAKVLMDSVPTWTGSAFHSQTAPLPPTSVWPLILARSPSTLGGQVTLWLCLCKHSHQGNNSISVSRCNKSCLHLRKILLQQKRSYLNLGLCPHTAHLQCFRAKWWAALANSTNNTRISKEEVDISLSYYLWCKYISHGKQGSSVWPVII